jgi:hypothetical protein
MRRFHAVQGIVCPHCANIFSKKCTLNRHIEQVLELLFSALFFSVADPVPF